VRIEKILKALRKCRGSDQKIEQISGTLDSQISGTLVSQISSLLELAGIAGSFSPQKAAKYV
jgi:hypothetical protein